MREAIDEVRADYRASLATTRRALRVPALRFVVLAFGVASAVEAATWLAIGVYAFQRSGAAAVGLVGLALLLPSAFAAPAASALSDRHRRKRILLATYLVEIAAVVATAVALGVDAPPPVVYALAVVAAAALTPVRPAQGALLPSISRFPADLTAANVSLTTVRNVGLLAGPLLAGLLLRLDGPTAVFAASGVLAAAAAWLIDRVPGDPRRPPAEVSATTSFVQGARLLVREERCALVIGVTFAKHVVLGAIRALLVIVALGLLGMGLGGAGVLSAAMGIGGVLAAGTAVLLIGRRRLTPALLLGMVFLGLPLVAIGAWPSVAVAVLAMVACGIGRSLVDVTARTLLCRVSPEDALARFLGILEGSSYAGLAIGSAASALLVHAAGIRGTLALTGVFLAIVVLALLGPLMAIDRGPLVSRDRLRLILGLPMFAALPPGSVESLAAQLEPVVVAPDTTLILQGDVGDRFYVLESGAARAEVDGAVVATYGPGDGFGEIALLHDVARTATVRVTEPSRVMALGRAPFLAVLATEPRSMVEAERLAADRLLDTAAQRSGGEHGTGDG